MNDTTPEGLIRDLAIWEAEMARSARELKATGEPSLTEAAEGSERVAAVMRRAINALSVRPAPSDDTSRSAPWRLVPVEPTEAMIEAGAEAWTPGIAGDGIRTSWAAMLDATPSPVPILEEGEPAQATDVVEKLIDAARDRVGVLEAALRAVVFDELRRAWFAGRGSVSRRGRHNEQYDSEAVEAAWQRQIDTILVALSGPVLQKEELE